MRLQRYAALPLALAALLLVTTPAVAARRPLWQLVPRYDAFGNDQGLADCMFTAAGNLEQLWNATARDHVAKPSRAAIEAAFVTADNEVRGEPSALMSYWQQTGIGGTRIRHFATLSLGKSAIASAVRRYEGVFAVVQLPSSPTGFVDVPTRTPVENEWSLSSATPATGPTVEHAVAIVGSWQGGLYAVSWGAVVRISWGWWSRFAVQAYEVSP